MIPNIPNPDYVNGSKIVSWLEVREESPDNGVQERLRWLHQSIRKQVEDIKVGRERNKKL
jgi:hypothetical protein